MDKKTISVIVPVYNVEAYLPRCLDSLMAQTYDALEFILVDDGSADSSGAICDQYAKGDSRFRVIHKVNGGLSSARNAGLHAACGDYIAFLDSDDWVEPEAYAYLLSLIEKYDVPMACGGRFDVEEESGRKTVGLCPEREEVISGEEMVRRIFRWENMDSAAWDKLYRRDLFREIRYPEGFVTEDVPTTYRLALLAGSAAVGNRPIYNYYHRSGSITISAVSEKTFHFLHHTRHILQDIRNSCPVLEPEARYLHIRALAYTATVLSLAEKSVRKQYSGFLSDSAGELRKEAGYILKSPFFSSREKRDNLLLAYGLYEPMLKLHFLLKKCRREK